MAPKQEWATNGVYHGATLCFLYFVKFPVAFTLNTCIAYNLGYSSVKMRSTITLNYETGNYFFETHATENVIIKAQGYIMNFTHP